MALLFHDEPVATYDLDIFCVVPQWGVLINLEPIYKALRARGYFPEAEAVVIGGVPVQFIPSYNALVSEALEQAEERSFEGVPVRVIGLDYLLAIMVQTNRPKDRQRLALLAETAAFSSARLNAILEQHNLLATWKALNLTA